MEDRKDNRLLSGLVDLKLTKGLDSCQEEVTILLHRVNVNKRN